MRVAALVVALVLAAAAAGCARDDDRAAVRAVAERFHSALEDRDWDTACAQLSTATRDALESQEREACPEAVGSLRLEGGAPDRVQVYVTNAKADLASGETAFLSLTPGGWRLSAVGCLPVGGKPADRPYDCRLEA